MATKKREIIQAEALEKELELEQYEGDTNSSVELNAKKFFAFIFEVFKVVVISLAIILPIRYFLVQPFYVQGESMEPNFEDKEYLIINEISYRFSDPLRGEVVILRSPVDRTKYYIKRVIGLPGETVEIKDGLVYINNHRLDEGYLDGDFASFDNMPATLLKDQYYFVMGDNRANSSDSRSFGPLLRSEIIGKVWLRGWPPTRIGSFNLPQY